MFRLNLNYNFGSTTIKATRDRNSGLSDETGRIK